MRKIQPTLNAKTTSLIIYFLLVNTTNAFVVTLTVIALAINTYMGLAIASLYLTGLTYAIPMWLHSKMSANFYIQNNNLLFLYLLALPSLLTPLYFSWVIINALGGDAPVDPQHLLLLKNGFLCSAGAASVSFSLSIYFTHSILLKNKYKKHDDAK